MCEITTMVTLALSAASAVAGYSAQQSVQRAQNDAMAAERARQAQLDNEAAAINESARQRYEGFDGQMDARAGALSEQINKGIGEAAEGVANGPTETLPSSSSTVVNQERDKQLGKVGTFTRQQGEALGKLRSFGSVLGDTSLDQARDAGLIGQIGNFKRGSANVHSYAMDAASKKGGNMKLFSDVLGGLASVSNTTGGQSAIGSMFGGLGGSGAAGTPGTYLGKASVGYGTIPTSALSSSVFR